MPGSQTVPGDVGEKTPRVEIPRDNPVHGHGWGEAHGLRPSIHKAKLHHQELAEEDRGDGHIHVWVPQPAQRWLHSSDVGKSEPSHHQMSWKVEERRSVPVHGR